ncbi:MAG: antitoxin family protein [Caldilineaceae bacterium]
MNKTVSAIYAAGALQLLEPVALPEAAKVQVQIFDREAEPEIGYRQTDSFRHCISNLRHLLTQVERHWAVDEARQTLPRVLRSELKTLWHLCEPPQRKLCAMLELSAKHLDEAQITHEQIAAFQFALEQLEKDPITEIDLKTCRQQLIAVGLPPRFTLGDEVVQTYVDEI